MAREVNVQFGTPTVTGINVTVPQYTMNVTFSWTDNAGVKHGPTTTTVLFPNMLAQIPPALLLETMKQLIVDRARVVLGVDA